MKRRSVLLAWAPAFAGVTAALSGCASFNTISADVSSFGDWPAGRAPGRYSFDRLPSQQQDAAAADSLEAAARPALLKAGFLPADAGQEPEVLVQLGARWQRSFQPPWDDPLWWHGGFAHASAGRLRRGPWIGPSWAHRMQMQINATRFDTEVAMLLRDRASGKPLFESHASRDSNSRADAADLTALFQAALAGFPKAAAGPHRVTVPLAP